MATSYSPKIITDGLLVCLDAKSVKSNGGGGEVWADVSGNGHNVTLYNSPTANVSGGYISFNGTDQYGTHTNVPAPNIATDYYTIELWFRLPSLPIADISSDGDGGGPLYGTRYGSDFQLFAYGASSSASSLGACYDDSRGNTNHRSTKSVVANEWVQFVHIGIPYDDGNYATRGKFKYYINGQLDTDETISSDSSGYSVNTTCHIAYDARYFDYCEVDMAVIRRYDRELTASEVLQNYNATKGRFGL